jgi:hypothetical protein
MSTQTYGESFEFNGRAAWWTPPSVRRTLPNRDAAVQQFFQRPRGDRELPGVLSRNLRSES